MPHQTLKNPCSATHHAGGKLLSLGFMSALLLILAMCLALPQSYAQAKTLDVYVDGTFYAQKTKAALDRVNEIRKEACDKGVPDPRNPKVKLTSSDYVPIKWSKDLEEIARQRAAEACILTDHMRPDGSYWDTALSSNGIDSFGENLAWNWSNNSSALLLGIEQWYEEKRDWVKQSSGVTGHYTSLINPEITYIGLACFNSSCGEYASTISCEFNWAISLPGGFMPTETKSGRTVSVDAEYVGKFSIDTSACSKKQLDVGHHAQLNTRVNLDFYGSQGTARLLGATWHVSNGNLSVSSTGKITGNAVGTCKVTASAAGRSASATITVKPAATQVSKLKAGKKSFKATWKKSTGKCTSGYKIRWSTSKKMKRAKSLTVKGHKAGSKKIKRLASKKRYYVQVRVYKKVDGKTYYSGWSKTKSVKVK